MLTLLHILRYGDIFRLDVGIYKTVFLCDWKMITEAARSEHCQGRPFGKLGGLKYIRPTDSAGNLLIHE